MNSLDFPTQIETLMYWGFYDYPKAKINKSLSRRIILNLNDDNLNKTHIDVNVLKREWYK